ncbi:zinc-binding dehydrogenase [Pectobacteriaceae bacterium CE70]|uniref:enoyl-[acyl-carrier-protein] reductase n=1 Tax=Serratia sp. (strain ATCC 39006) TaxID=104623 RepID=A0A2I5TFP1_SERS3|nr:zinc-binding dehydrogenase [Serratia sp. ATCC 39006]WJV62340.1 zinc-binding dehydrogenase [Pectobacteriaceae bacterium C52]WJV66644.1 zinc-binding dehydrogenase [Pectobacteriaceae bacterium CE70]WJY10644.1 zinc-binding dehydrogenase [Pectobacteriaceae bacterium C80]AUG99054.1 alcohol dehydrogenase [Serratia sp. ATCC 39006]AUH03369.1 alcohol dehydrogenase [Serratia sp. ATCC 39006]
MRSVTHASFGNPAEVLTLTEVPQPQPGPEQILVRMTYSPIHNHDLWTIRGMYGHKPVLPGIGGSEAAGVIDALGSNVQHLKIGQRVVTAGVHGTWAEYFLATATAAVPLPDEINDKVGCQLIAMPVSALMLLEYLDIKPGQWMIQNAANGTVGKTVAMLAKSRGIHVINLVRRHGTIKEMAALGLRNTISTDHPDWQEQIAALLDGKPLVRAVDSVGGKSSGDLLHLLSEGGVLVSFGAMSGQPMQISSGDMIFKQVTIKGFWASKVASTVPAQDKQRMIGELIHLAASGDLILPVDSLFDLSDAVQAVTASERPGRQGKILLRG